MRGDLYRLLNFIIRAAAQQRSSPESRFASKNFNQKLRCIFFKSVIKVTHVGWDGTAQNLTSI